ncbi:acetyl ornithine aminotransferase family protein [Thermofilum pendens]|uniref:Ornithine aminotransferase n=1 Tax=Thermofilum pendens (strain DSM 2475 / Hrk 5) TaxID=368408 RepID=A1RXL5_THEPD|nr:acetyl ornithine aminotransferase family protein [Thermofilum pendens]ABL77945.1 4-aminobutyrate aminotransferase [Thermofilum pendens Hrk 5]
MNGPKIIVEPPGPNSRKIAEKDSALLMQSFARWYPLVAKRAHGVWVEDVDGNVYLDFNSGIGVTNTGHCHPKVVKAIKEQAERLLHYSLTDFLYEEPVKLAEKLVSITPGRFPKKVFYTNSGTESIEAAIKTARGHFRGTRPYIIAFAGSFHGRTYGSLSLTSSKPVQRRHLGPLLPGVFHAPYPYCYRCPFRQKYPECNLWCVDFIEEWMLKKYVPPEEVAAFVVEPIAGEGGYIVPPPEFFKRLRELADKYGILLVVDEVQSGFGRTGKWFAIEHFGVEPDIIAVAKGIASGLPLGAIIGRAEVMDLPPGSHASTFGGNPVSCAAALATIEVIEEEKLLDNATRVGEYAMKRLRELQEEIPYIGDVRGKGLMIGVELIARDGSPNPKLLQKTLEIAFKKGLLVIGAGVSTIRIAPPLIITQQEMETGLRILEESLREALKEV